MQNVIPLRALGLLGAGLCAACTPAPPATSPSAPTASGAANGTSAETSSPRQARDHAAAACTPPTLPSYAQLPANPKLNDPFQTLGGQRITHKSEWACRRAELGAAFEEYELGPKPPKPSQLRAELAADELAVTVGDGQKSMSFKAKIHLPPTGKAPYPALIGLGKSSLDNAALAELGIALIDFPNSELAEQKNGESRGHGSFYELYGSDHPAGAMIAWAWGVSRLIDALEATPGAQIDPARLGVTGCSRNGKGAIVVGAFDERIQLTIPQESGAGGSASWRISDAQHADWIAAGSPEVPVKQDVQTLHEITGENVWFRSSFSQFNDTANKLPFDHHLLLGMVAPRALLVIENTSMYWLGKTSTFTTAVVAHHIWDALGVPDRMGVSQLGNHEHCHFPEAQRPELVAFAQKFLVGSGQPDTHILKTDGDFKVDEQRWVDWTTPTLD
jgi:hypothetical protein